MTASTLTRDTETVGSAHLRLVGLSKIYPGQSAPAVDDVSLTLEPGKLLALLGPSGCGKTTTLRMVAGLIEASGGQVEVDGSDITGVAVHKRRMGMVFQSYALFPHLDVARNVAFGLEMQKVSKTDRAKRVTAALDMVQLGHLAQRRVKELSGGQQQRVALARALVVEPSVLLLDEPLSNLDAKLRGAMRAEIRAIVHRLGVTTVFVTHDQDEALSMADEIVVMNDGKVEQVGAPEEIYRRPSSRFVADFIGRANLLSGTVTESTTQDAVVEVPSLGQVRAAHSQGKFSPAQPVTVLVRPHHVQVEARTSGTASDEKYFLGRITDLSYTGEMVAYSIAIGDVIITAETLTGLRETLRPGQDVSVGWKSSDALVLPERAGPEAPMPPEH